MIRSRLLLPALVLAAAAAPAQQSPPRPASTQPASTQLTPPAGFANPDHEIVIGVRPALLRYDTESFAVRPGSKVKLTLVNGDEMQHNLLICRPGEGVTQKVGMAALQLGAEATAKHFVPESPDVLFHTKAILPGEQDTIWFTAPAEPGDYGYVCTLPGHMFTMKGVMRVGDAEPDTGGPLGGLRYRVFEGKWTVLPDFDALEPADQGELSTGLIDVGVAERRADYGIRFEGALQIASAGKYTFLLNSDDGSRLYVDGRMVTEWDGTHPGGKAREGGVELGAGVHALRVDFFQGGGGQLLEVAVRGPDGTVTPLARTAATKPPEEQVGIPIAVHHQSRVLRVHVEGASSRTLAVGLHGGTNYAFDAERCCVQFGWSGAFLDVGPDRLGRGGQPCKTLGPRFTVGDLGFPLQTFDGRERPVRFVGYRNGPGAHHEPGSHGAAVPEFLFDWGGQQVRQQVRPAAGGIGLEYTFTLAEPGEGVRFRFDPQAVRCTSSTGMVGGDTLAVSGAQAGSFTVTLTPLQEGDR